MKNDVKYLVWIKNHGNKTIAKIIYGSLARTEGYLKEIMIASYEIKPEHYALSLKILPELYPAPVQSDN
jgi:hypothetical protein